MGNFYSCVIEPFIPPCFRMDQNTLDELPSIADVVHGVKSVVDFQKAWKFLVWIILVYIAEYAGNHGLVFVIVSGIAAVFLNLSNENSTGISAYSVFNRNAQRMLGSLTAEQFEVYFFIYLFNFKNLE